MSKVLIVISSYRWGGINVALQNWLRRIDPTKTSVDLFVMVHSGNYEGGLPNCNILPKHRWLDCIVDHAGMKHGMDKVLSVVLKSVNRVFGGRLQSLIYKLVGQGLVRGKGYDAVIGWHEGAPTYFVSEINHGNKITWVHCDYSQYSSIPSEKKLYDKIDKVVCVSKYTKGTFLSIYPYYKDKVYTIYNVLDIAKMRELATEDVEERFDTSKFTIVSLGRVSPVKNFSVIPQLARKLKDKGCEFKWYIVGPLYGGEEEQLLMDRRQKLGVEEDVILLGGKQNPYPYLAKADVVVCTSKSEALPFVVTESFAMGRPVICSNFGSAFEMIEIGVNGFVDSVDRLDIYIERLYADKELYGSMLKALAEYDYDNESVMRQVEALIEK